MKKFMHQTFQRVCSLAVCGGCLGLAAASAAARQQAVELWPTATEMPADNGWDYEDEALGPPDCPDCTVGTSGCVAKEEASFPTHDYMKLRAFRTSGGGQYSLPGTARTERASGERPHADPRGEQDMRDSGIRGHHERDQLGSGGSPDVCGVAQT